MEDLVKDVKETTLSWMLNRFLKISRVRKQLKQVKAENYAGLSSDMIAMFKGQEMALKEYDKICRERRKK
jgi:hypothetical protein